MEVEAREPTAGASEKDAGVASPVTSAADVARCASEWGDDDLELEGLIECQETTFAREAEDGGGGEAAADDAAASDGIEAEDDEAEPDFRGLAKKTLERLVNRIKRNGGDWESVANTWRVEVLPLSDRRQSIKYVTIAPCGRRFHKTEEILNFLKDKKKCGSRTVTKHHESRVYTMGERVRARYNRGTAAYGALVCRAYRDVDDVYYDLAYDDGFRDARLPSRFIREVCRVTPVELRRLDGDDWIYFDSQAVAIRQLAPVLTQPMLLRLLHGTPNPDDPFRARRADAKPGKAYDDDAPRPARAVGDAVLAMYDRGGVFYKGTILRVVKGGQAYDICYDDGDTEFALDAYYVLDADDARGTEGVEGLEDLKVDGAASSKKRPPRAPAAQPARKAREPKKRKATTLEADYVARRPPRGGYLPPRPVQVRRRGDAKWLTFSSLAKASRAYPNLPAWLVGHLANDPGAEHALFEVRRVAEAPPQPTDAPAAAAAAAATPATAAAATAPVDMDLLERGTRVAHLSRGAWRHGVVVAAAETTVQVFFEDGKRPQVARADAGLHRLDDRCAPPEGVPDAVAVDPNAFLYRAVAQVGADGKPKVGTVVGVDAEAPGKRPTVHVHWSKEDAPRRFYVDAFRADLLRGLLVLNDPIESDAVAALRAENARLRADLRRKGC